LFEGGFFGTQTFVVFAGKIYRANRGTFPTAGAFIQIDVAGTLTYAGLKIPGFAFKI
jgi:hypothetical protein